MEAEPRPIRVVVDDELARSRLTVGFRLILAIPHLFWVSSWGFFVFLLAIPAWFVALFTGSAPKGLADFFVMYVRYSTRLSAYLMLAADPYPPFVGGPTGYPVAVELEPKLRQNRWKTGFRLVLAIPALLLSGALGAGVSLSAQTGAGSFGVALTAALLGWFACLARGRMPAGLRDLVVYALGYSAQLTGYLLLLTDRYPNADPPAVASGYSPPRPFPVRLTVDTDLRRSRLTVFFRLALATPHFVWLTLWSLVALLAVIGNWFVILFRGRPAGGLHRFNGRYVRYQTHVYAFTAVLGDRFPGFGGAPGSYEIDLEVDPPARQNRWKTGFRLVLAVPALMIVSSLQGVLLLVAVFGWFASLFTARMPLGLRNAGALAVRYSAEWSAYLMLLSDAYPHSGVSIGARRSWTPPAPLGAPSGD